MKNISFAYTVKQFRDRTKTVTRRIGWDKLEARTFLRAVRKSQGLKKGEKVETLGVIKVISVTLEPLNDITQDDVIREGFPNMTTEEFINFFCQVNKCQPDTLVNRIHFEYL